MHLMVFLRTVHTSEFLQFLNYFLIAHLFVLMMKLPISIVICISNLYNVLWSINMYLKIKKTYKVNSIVYH